MPNMKQLSFKSLTLHDTYSIFSKPIRVMYQSGSAQKGISIEFTKGNEIFTNLLEDIIVEYNSSAGKQELYTTEYRRSNWAEYKNTYLKTYVSVGIPRDIYNSILKEADQQFEKRVVSTHDSISNGYVWVTAEVHYPNPQCMIYSRTSEAPIYIGSLYDIMIQLKSNVRGYGHFDITILVSDYTYFLKFSLVEFQVVDETNLSSSYRPCMDVDISEDLKKKLDKFK